MVDFPILAQSVALDFANSVFAWNGEIVEGLDRPEGLKRWIEALGDRLIEQPRATEALRSEAIELRAAIRSALAALVAGGRPDTAAPRRLIDASAGAPAWTELRWPDEGPTSLAHRVGPPSARFLAELADDAMALLSGPDAAHLRACPGPGCIGYFLQDHGRREYCSTACATRGRVARHYRRHHSDRAPVR